MVDRPPAPDLPARVPVVIVGAGLMGSAAAWQLDARGVETIDKIRRGERVVENTAVLTDLCNTMKFGSLCALGGFTPYPVMSALKHFPDDFSAPARQQAAE